MTGKRRSRLLLASLLTLGFALRLWRLGAHPAGLNQDEASALYESWALLRWGMDRNGYAHPVLLRAWGSGQNVLYSVLCKPFIALFGLDTLAGRLPMALLGCASLLLLYDLSRRSRDQRSARWVLLALAVNPWHVLLSRWALESNVLPFMLLLGTYCLERTAEREEWLMGAAAALALSLYAYGTAFFFLLLFLPAASVWLWRGRRTSLKTYFLSLGIFILLALPVTLCQLRNALGWGAGKFLWLSLPALSEGRQNATSILGGGSLTGNFAALLRLLWTQSDGLLWNGFAPYGLFYGKCGLLLSLTGLAVSLRERRDVPMLLWLLSAFLACGCIDVNVNRANMLFLPLVFYQGRGLQALSSLLHCRSIPAAAALLAAACFAFSCFGSYAQRLAPCFYDGLCPCIAEASERETGTKFLSFDVNMPYIYVLFTEQMPPQTFQRSVRYMNPDAPFEWVTAVEGWHFGREPEGESCAVLRADRVPPAYAVVSRHGEWCVCVPAGEA